MDILLAFAEEIIASVVIASIALLLFDVNEWKRRLFRLFGRRFYRSFERVSSREQVVRNFNKLFVSYTVDKGGKIYLMSEAGGYPEYDPYPRIVELASHAKLEIYVAVTLTTMQCYFADQPDTAIKLVTCDNIRLYVFDDLTPYKFRIGLNTDLQDGFFCAYYGHRGNKVDLEGIRSDNPIMVEAFENLYLGLLGKGTQITEQNLQLVKVK